MKRAFQLSLKLLFPVIFRSNRNAAIYVIIALDVQRETHVRVYVKGQSLLSAFKPNWYFLVNVKSSVPESV
jgi:hypothetical protein